METIFDYNPTEEELQRFGGMKQFEFCKKLLGAYYIYEDDANYHLGLLFSMRGDKERAKSYFAKIKKKEMLSTLMVDCYPIGECK